MRKDESSHIYLFPISSWEKGSAISGFCMNSFNNFWGSLKSPWILKMIIETLNLEYFMIYCIPVLYPNHTWTSCCGVLTSLKIVERSLKYPGIIPEFCHGNFVVTLYNKCAAFYMPSTLFPTNALNKQQTSFREDGTLYFTECDCNSLANVKITFFNMVTLPFDLLIWLWAL